MTKVPIDITPFLRVLLKLEGGRVERGIIKAKFHRGLLKRVDFIESMQRWEL
ncbi:MAG: hypothetical protein IJQ44_00210 [Bacteroidaceae bacterium]|nr:hypothetical protein [Bacteroidaceae bacterium]